MTGTIVACAAAVGLAAVALAGRAQQVAGQRSAWLTSGVHVLLATLGGAGAAALGRSWAEVATFALLALGGALLVVVDLAVHRLPDVIVLPCYGVLGVGLAVAAWAGDEWLRYAGAVAAAAALGAGYLLLAWASPTGLGLGDVKLAGVLGGFLGWFGWATVLAGSVLAFLLGGAVAAVLLLTRRADRRTALPFGPWMIAGAVAAVLLDAA